jgi:hypothetical protein
LRSQHQPDKVRGFSWRELCLYKLFNKREEGKYLPIIGDLDTVYLRILGPMASLGGGQCVEKDNSSDVGYKAAAHCDT